MNILDDPYGAGATGVTPGAPAPGKSTLITGGGGYTQPDWQKLMDQYLAPYQSIYDAQMAALGQRVGAQTQLANQRFSGSDTSTMARLGTEHDDMVRNIIHSLAGRGLIDSGDKGFQDRREALRYKRSETDASNQLLDYLTGLQSSLADARFQGLLGLQNQRLGIASTLGSLYQPKPNPTNISKIVSPWPSGSGVSPAAASAISQGFPG